MIELRQIFRINRSEKWQYYQLELSFFRLIWFRPPALNDYRISYETI